jgi:tRNA (guanine26-N2/guanine27-N2)-dimethyltransferase
MHMGFLMQPERLSGNNMYKEGKAAIKYTKEAFLNPEAVMSRDLSVAFVATTSDKNSAILDATAATGIRGIRYYRETPSKNITLLEINSNAYGSLVKNIKFNKIKAKVIAKSIQEFANTTRDKFDFIDLDPFGGATPYIYDLMKVSKDGTCLLITVTDTAVLCGADYKACMRLYDARPMHNDLCHEVGMRILIGYVTRIAAQFNFGIEMIGSFDYLHYMRIILKLRHGSQRAIDSIKKLGYVHYCNRCLYRTVESKDIPNIKTCKLCKNLLETSGKVWLGNLYDKDSIELMLNEMKKEKQKNYHNGSIEFVESISKELDMPLYYSIPKLTKKMRIGAVSMSKVIALLQKKGFEASRTHMSINSIKTTADLKTIKSSVSTASKDI